MTHTTDPQRGAAGGLGALLGLAAGLFAGWILRAVEEEVRR